MKVIAVNKKALFDYEIQEIIEAGIVLCGDEVKSIRQGKVSLIGAFATIHAGELFLINCNITVYSHAYTKSEELARQRRKLLLHKKQLMRLIGDMSRKGVVLVPLKLYFTEKNKVKVQIGLGKHKKMSEKKEILKERDIKRETLRSLKGF
ncbi:SsrA-binding protein SmpB [Candidatus Dependentiae bacterium]|nr:MAG: SsrA-binding protein SmpB [Candidatus Dependentiae bacterium]